MSVFPRSEFGVSIVTFEEQATGCHALIKRARSRQELLRGYEILMDVLADFRSSPVLPFAAAEAATFDQIRRGGVRIGTMDLRIAATALANGLTLLTRNAKDFARVPGLAFEDWTAP
jgi:tRNA(fMet)-specific endonuclease VapC